MPSQARHGSAARPEAAPHAAAPPYDQRYDSSGYGGYETGYDGGAYGGPHEQGVYEQAGYAQGGHAHRGYEHGGYEHGGYEPGVYAHGGHAEAGYRQSPYDTGAYAVDSVYGSPVPGAPSHGDFGDRAESGTTHGGHGDFFADGAPVASAGEDGAARRRGGAEGATRAPRPTRTQARAAARARNRRKRRMRTSFLGVGSVAAVAVIAVAGFVNPHHGSASAAQADASAVPVAGRTGDGDASRSIDRATPAAAVKQLPGLGKAFLAKVPANAQQVLLVTGKGRTQNDAVAVLYTRTAAGGWMAGPTWAARNAKDGWTANHHAGDLHSPIGVFSLTDAGGLDPNPGTKLPYTHSSAFTAPGTGFEGESLADAFDYVVAINYNHVPGTSPLSAARPMGAARGGGIWVHVDHGGPTHGCVALAKNDMRALLQALDPSKHPVIVMGDAASLAQ